MNFICQQWSIDFKLLLFSQKTFLYKMIGGRYWRQGIEKTGC